MDYNEFNFILEKVKSTLYNQFQNCKLPLGAILYLVKDIYHDLQNQYIASINDYSISNPKQVKINQNNADQESKQSQVE